MRKIAWIGHLLDRYDQALFTILAPSLAPIFFPLENPLYGLIATFCLLPIGLLSRPLGAYVFGRLGDKYGYHRAFSTTLLGMALTTVLIGCLPGYDKIGILAPILLGSLRLLQNFFSAGESTGAAIVTLSGVAEHRRSFVSSLVDASGMLGTFLGSFACTISWYYGISWRILFFTAFFSAIVGWYFRKYPENIQTPSQKKGSLRALWQHKREIWAIASVSGFSYANYYLITVFFNGFIPLLGIANDFEVTAVNTWMLGLDLCLLPAIGALAKNRSAWIKGALVGSFLLAIPLYLLLDPDAAWSWIGVRMVFMILGVCLAAPYHAWSLDIAPYEHRYAVKAIGNAIGSRFLGAPAPAIALWIYQISGWKWAPALIVLGTSLMALSSFLLLPKKAVYATET